MVNLNNYAVKQFGVDGADAVDELAEFLTHGVALGIFRIGHKIDIGVVLEHASNVGAEKEMVFAVDRPRGDIFTSEGDGIWGISTGAPGTEVVGNRGELTVFGEGEVDFENAVAKLVIIEESFARVSIIIAINAAESMGNIGVVGPRIIETISGGSVVK